MGKAEGKIEDYLASESTKRGYMCKKFVSPGYDGVPDRIIIGKGIVFFVETKAPGEKTRKLQRSVIRKMMSYGGIVYVADTKEDVNELLDEMDSIAGRITGIVPEFQEHIRNMPAMQATIAEVNT